MHADSEIRAAHELAKAFTLVVRNRRRAALNGWLEQAEASELAGFRPLAATLRRDQGSVEATLHSEWSNGQTEGQITRLTCSKRQMYGRVSFGLLRQRVLREAG